MDIELVDLGSLERDPKTNALLVQAKGMAVGEDGDAPDYGKTPHMCALGLTAGHWPADSTGGAQGIVARCDGIDGVLIAARDTRNAKVAGAVGPGDTILHTTGPEQAAQVQLKEVKRQVAAVTKDTRGKTVALILDGTEDKVQIVAFGCAIEVSREQGVVISDNTGGCTIQMKDGTGSLMGTWVIGGRVPLFPLLMGASGPAGVSVPGVFGGK